MSQPDSNSQQVSECDSAFQCGLAKQSFWWLWLRLGVRSCRPIPCSSALHRCAIVSNVWSLNSPRWRVDCWNTRGAHCLSRTFLDIASIRLMPYIQTSNTHTQSFHWIRAHCCASNHVAFGIVLCAQKLAMREVRCTLPLYELPGQSHCHLHSCYFLPLWAQLYVVVLGAILWS